MLVLHVSLSQNLSYRFQYFSDFAFSTDASETYLRRAKNLRRKISVKPYDLFGLSSDKIQKLWKLLNSFAESGNYRNQTFRKHLAEDLVVNECISYPAVLHNMKKHRLLGICATYVDGTLHNVDKNHIAEKND